MKTIRDIIKEGQADVSYRAFKIEVENIIKSNGFTILKDKSKTNPYVIHSNHTTSNAYIYGSHDVVVDEYVFTYSYDNGSSKKYGFNSQTTESFQLQLCLWYDKEKGRPRYKFVNFSLKYPEVLGGGYDTQSDWITFPSKIVNSEFCELALKHITMVVSMFNQGKSIMDRAWEVNGSKKLLKNDFQKVVSNMFGKVIKRA